MYLSIERLKEIKPEDIEKMDYNELFELTLQASKQARTRLNRVEQYKNKLVTPAIYKDRGKGSLKDFAGSRLELEERTTDKSGRRNTGMLKKELLQAQQFVKLETSTVSGARQYTRKLEQSGMFDVDGKKKSFVNLSDEQKSNFWDVYTAFYHGTAFAGEKFKGLSSEQRFRMVRQIVNSANKTGVSPIDLAHERITKWNERLAEYETKENEDIWTTVDTKSTSVFKSRK